ncbi:MAG: HAMP domain-containing sensor histidine kinase [Candidatus Gracilibacteria bacterium]|nr:HAMP domain-containing sensor histidine kinase [Candidatus Gracilibacteria bacterium]
MKTKELKTSTRIALIFSIFTFCVLLFMIIFINVFTYINWHKAEENEISESGYIGHIINTELDEFIEEQLETIELEIFLLFFLTFLSFVLSKILFSKLILKDIYYISNKLKNTNTDTIKKLKINNNKDDEINIIVNSINNFIELTNKNTKSLKDFNSQVSHEFKSPLMIISSELEYLNLSGKKESYKKIEKQVDKMNNLLESFLLLTKIQNTSNIKKEYFNLLNIINDNLVNLEKQYSKNNIQIINNIGKNNKILSNKYYFEIVIKNLLDNAFKYNINGGNIEINYKNNILKIKNSGIIIKKENLDKIWDSMYRENSFGDGYGIGLNLVKKIIDILGYKISVKSNKNIGTEFSIEFM